MFGRQPRGSQLGFLVVNIIGWLLLFFFYARTDRIDVEELESQGPALEARLALVETSIEKLAAQFETSTGKLLSQLDALQKQGESQLAEAPKKPSRTPADNRLADAQLRKLESATARLEDELGLTNARTHVTVDLHSLVQGLRPLVSFGVLRTDIKRPGVIDMTFQVRNSGAHAAIVDVPELVLATKPIPPSGPADGRLIATQDYSVQGRIGTFLPNEPSNHAYTVTLTDPKRLEQPIYYRMTFRTSTDPTVVATSSRLLQGKLAAKDVQELSVAQYTHIGELSAAR
jgi:hypothetical protein